MIRLSTRAGAPARRGGALLVILTLALGPVILSDPVGAVETRLTPDADARVEASDPDRNYGSSSRLIADLSPVRESYLRFTVPAGTSRITKATLRLWVKNASSDGPEVRVAANDWGASTVTWNTRPEASGLLADADRLTEDTWASYDVTAGVTGPGPVSFLLQADSKDGTTYASSRDSRYPPELVIEAASPDGTAETDVPAEIDAYGEESSPDRNFGSKTVLKVQGGRDPGQVSYLRFGVGDLPGPVRRVVLRVYVTNGTVDGPAVLPTTGGWAEDSLTWLNRPGPAGDVLASVGAVEKGWIDFDVSRLVTGPGTYNLMLQTSSADTFAFRSSEGAVAERPRLVVTTGPVPTTTSSTTTSSTTTSSTTTSSTTTSSTTTTTTTLPPTTTTTTTLPPTTTTLPPTTTTTAPSDTPTSAETGEPWLGLARLVTEACEPECVRSTYSLSVEEVSDADTGDRRGAFRFPPGSSQVLRLEWARAATGGGCGSPAEVTMDVSLRRPGGARIGSAVWNAGIPPTCTGVLQRDFHLDTDPMDGAGDDDPFHGVMEVYGRLSEAGAATGADTRGAVPVRPGPEPGRYARGHLVSGGVMVGWHESGDDPDRLAANEAILGEPFGLVRSYSSTWKTPNNRVRNWLAEGKFVLWSVKPPHNTAGEDDWTPVADGSQDEMIRQQVAVLQTWAESGGTQAGYIFNHEPHDNTDFLGVVDDCEAFGDSSYPCSGTAVEFIDSYERIRAAIDELGADRVHLVYTATMTRAAETAPGSSVLGSGDPMTRGEAGESVVDYVDLIAHDSYNWYCFWSRCRWEFPDESGGWEKAVRLAETQGKPLIMAETASHPGCDPSGQPAGYGCGNEDSADLPSPTRDDWLARIGPWLESDARARRWLVGFVYYHTLHRYDWRFVGQTGVAGSGVEAWRNSFVVDSALNDGLGGHDYFAQYGFNNL